MIRAAVIALPLLLAAPRQPEAAYPWRAAPWVAGFWPEFLRGLE